MPFEIKDTLPFTHEQAVTMLTEAPWTEQERKLICDGGLVFLHHGFGGQIRDYWHLWEPTTPLSRHYQQKFGLGHADDMSTLIIEDMVARLRGERYAMDIRVQRIKKYWLNQNVDPLYMKEIQ
ncbi:MAG: DUF6794 domain-containing protein [Thermomicrobiales bacterium]